MRKLRLKKDIPKYVFYRCTRRSDPKNFSTTEILRVIVVRFETCSFTNFNKFVEY